MSDDIERLLAEVNSTTSKAPKSQQSSAVSRKSDAELTSSTGGRLGFAVVCALLFGVVGLVVGLFVPFFLGTFSTGVGAAAGAFGAALLAGPPKWFSS
ncbi:MAG: hypothetical protein WAO41_06670 [Candidatus Nanopelagicales bacterium]